MTTYEVISGHTVCGVDYVEAVATYENDATMHVIKRKTDIDLQQALKALQDRLSIPEVDIKHIQSLIDEDYQSRKNEEEID